MQSKVKSLETMYNPVAIGIGFFFVFFGFGGAQQFLSVFLKHAGFKTLGIVSLLLLYSVYLAVNSYAPTIIAWFGSPRRSLIVGAATYAIFPVGAALSSPPIIIICSALIGVGASLLWVSADRIIAHVSSDNIGRGYGLEVSGALGGSAAGIFSGGFIAAAWGEQAFFLIMALVTACGTLLLLRVLDVELPKTAVSHRAEIWREGALRYSILAIMAASFLAAIGFTSLSLRLADMFGVIWVGPIGAVLKLGSVFGIMFATFNVSPRRYPTLLIIALCVMALSAYMFSTSIGLTASLLTALCLGASAALIQPLTMSTLRRSYPAEGLLGVISGYYVWTTGSVVLGIGMNLLLDPIWCFRIGAVLSLLAIPGIMLILREMRLADEQEQKQII